MAREYDVVLLGATGFVGRLTAAHLAAERPPGARIAFAGRSQDKLDSLRADLGPAADGIDTLVVDASDDAALAALAASTTVLATTVGPYVRSGMPVVRACAAAGTHYADLTGEVLFVRQSADECHELAESTGAKIVHACGFDSIPSDLGVMVTADTAAAEGSGQLTVTTLYVRSLKGGFSGGTIDSARQQAILARADRENRAILTDRYALSPARDEEPSQVASQPQPNPGKLRRSGPRALATAPLRIAGAAASAGLGRLSVHRDPRTGHWLAPFVMAQFNTRIVRRSNALLGWAYGREFRYSEVTDLGSKPQAPLMAAGMSGGMLAVLGGLSFGPTRAVLDRVLPKPGDGPSQERRAAGRFVLDVIAATTSGATYRTRFGAGYDPGYEGTAIMFGQAALALAFDADLPDRAGVLTPATAIGMPLVNRLRSQEFTIVTHRED